MSTHNDTPWWDPDLKTAAPASDAAEEAQNPGEAAQESLQTDAAETAQTPKGSPHALHYPLLKAAVAWAASNRHTVIYTIIGLVLAVGILCFGFWRTFLVAFFVGTGYLYGSWRDGNPRLNARIRRFYEHFIDNNPFMK